MAKPHPHLPIVVAARELISDPARWCKGVQARDERGYAVGPRTQEACKWCALGALVKCTPNDGPYDDRTTSKGMRTALALAGMFPKLAPRVGKSLVIFNDACMHSDMLAVFDEAIVQLRVGVDV